MFSCGAIGQFVRHASRICVLLGVIYIAVLHPDLGISSFPLFLEGITQVVCSEWNRWMQRRRAKSSEQGGESSLLEKGSTQQVECVATVVGYREDPEVFEKCLRSYQENYDGVAKATFIGVDGDEEEDMPMVQIAERVFGAELYRIELSRTFGSYVRSDQTTPGEKSFEIPLSTPSEETTAELIHVATGMLRDIGLLYTKKSSGGVPALCIAQPHCSKKEIMFTTFIFALAYAKAMEIDFVWSSDSDSWIYPDTLSHTFRAMAGDERIGGSCTRMVIHNGHVSGLSRVVAAMYGGDLALTSGLLSAFNANDCQSGPCAAFRTSAMEKILLPWMQQRVLGRRPVVNEDRHLTTCLLLRGYLVTHNPDALVATDTPTTLPKFIVQQTRWARAIAIEGLFYPSMYLRCHPVLVLQSFRRFLVPITSFYAVGLYLWSGTALNVSSLKDMWMRLLLVCIYVTIRQRLSPTQAVLNVLSQILLQVPSAAFLLWATMTAFEDDWGTGARSGSESLKIALPSWYKKHMGPFSCTTIWCVLCAAALGKSLGLAVYGQGQGGSVGAAVAGVVVLLMFLNALRAKK